MAKKPLPTTPPKFNVGDIVYLVTGGPSMSVSEQLTDFDHGNYPFNGNYRCQWFAGKKLDSGSFPEESLTATNPKP
ncbi:YodC family protein [Pantoea sp. GABEPS69]|uniref:YodC family protein n=1 Tax=Pantoea sp. GABEPS69 TaxID=3028805 RepID=UPI0038928DA9